MNDDVNNLSGPNGIADADQQNLAEWVALGGKALVGSALSQLSKSALNAALAKNDPALLIVPQATNLANGISQPVSWTIAITNNCLAGAYLVDATGATLHHPVKPAMMDMGNRLADAAVGVPITLPLELPPQSTTVLEARAVFEARRAASYVDLVCDIQRLDMEDAQILKCRLVVIANAQRRK